MKHYLPSLSWVFLLLPILLEGQSGFPEEDPIAYQRAQSVFQQRKEVRTQHLQVVTQATSTYLIQAGDTTFADSCWKTTAYDRNGNLVSETCHPLHYYEPYRLEYQYNENGRPVRVKKDGRLLKEFFYDSCGRVTVISECKSVHAVRQIHFAYTPDMGQLCRLDVYDLIYRSYMDSLHHDYMISKRLVESYGYCYGDAGKKKLKYQLFPKTKDSLLLEYVSTDTGVVLYDRNSACGRYYYYSTTGYLKAYNGCDNDQGPPWGTARYEYDEQGRVKTAHTGDLTTTYYYDRYGKVVQEVATDGRDEKVTNYLNQYDPRGNLIRSVAMWPGGMTITSYGYDFHVVE